MAEEGKKEEVEEEGKEKEELEEEGKKKEELEEEGKKKEELEEEGKKKDEEEGKKIRRPGKKQKKRTSFVLLLNRISNQSGFSIFGGHSTTNSKYWFTTFFLRRALSQLVTP